MVTLRLYKLHVECQWDPQQHKSEQLQTPTIPTGSLCCFWANFHTFPIFKDGKWIPSIFHAYLDAQDCTHWPWHCQNGEGGKNGDMDWILDSPSQFCLLSTPWTLIKLLWQKIKQSFLAQKSEIVVSPHLYLSAICNRALKNVFEIFSLYCPMCL